MDSSVTPSIDLESLWGLGPDNFDDVLGLVNDNTKPEEDKAEPEVTVVEVKEEPVDEDDEDYVPPIKSGKRRMATRGKRNVTPAAAKKRKSSKEE